MTVRILPRVLLVLLLLELTFVSSAARAQSSERDFDTGITGSAPGGPSNPTTMMADPSVRDLILELAEHPVAVRAAEKGLASGAYDLKATVEAGLTRVDRDSVRLALNYVSAADQRLIASKARVYGRELADLVLARRSKLEAAIEPLAATDAERRAILFFLVGCVALDWDGLGYTQSAGYRAGPTVRGTGYAYTPWMKENAPDISRRGLYWGSHNSSAGAYTFTTFGDHEALPRIALPDLFFALSSPFSTLETDDGVVAGRRLVAAYGGTILSDAASVLLAIHDGARDTTAIGTASGVSASRVASLLSLLEAIHFVRRGDGGYESQVSVLKDDAKPASERVVALVREAMKSWHESSYADVKRELSDLTALRQGIPFEAIYTEIWHYVFGYANLFLSEERFFADPYDEGAPFRGFLPFLWAASVDTSS